MNGFDPQAPLIGKDGLEYACVADKILNRPVKNHRNDKIRELRAEGRTESQVRAWANNWDNALYGGKLYIPTSQRCW